jgi:hypothetical protein
VEPERSALPEMTSDVAPKRKVSPQVEQSLPQKRKDAPPKAITPSDPSCESPCSEELFNRMFANVI